MSQENIFNKLRLLISAFAILLVFIGDIVLNIFRVIGSIVIGLFLSLKKIFLIYLNLTNKAGLTLQNVLKKLVPLKIRVNRKKIATKIRDITLRVKYVFVGIIITLVVVLSISSYIFVHSLPNPKMIGLVNYPVATKIFDRNGKLLYEIHKDQDRTPIKIAEVKDYVWQATIAIEDKSYFSHNGISIVNGMLRALKESIRTKHVQGGSTITQQLIKTALLTPERTIDRKIREIILALWAEQLYSKKEILEMYLNQVPYGGSAYGIEAASQIYFGIKAHDLTIAQAALLAGLPQAPSIYSPYSNGARALRRRSDVLKAMLAQGYITKQQFEIENVAPLNIRKPDSYIKAPHFVFYVKSKLEELFGTRMVEEGGLRVTTTLDLDLQEKAQEIVAEEIAGLRDLRVGNGAAIVTTPHTGEILAMVGSRDYFEEPYGSYNVTTALRQPGSSIKPLMYSLALERGYTAASIIDDSPVSYQSQGAPAYSPVNYDGNYHGLVPLRYALANSYNVPAVKVLNTLGVDNFINHATNLGLTTLNEPDRYGLSITLGGAEVKLTDMVVAYGVFANYGKKIQIDPLLKVVDFQGQELYRADSAKYAKQVLSDSTAFIISDILSDNSARQSSFGSESQLVIPDKQVAVKTGTTNSKRDNVTIGYTRSFLTAVWVGNNDNTPMDQQLTSGVTGAAPIWNKLMTEILNRNWGDSMSIESGFPVPDSVVQKKCFFGRPEYFVKDSEISIDCTDKQLSR